MWSRLRREASASEGRSGSRRPRKEAAAESGEEARGEESREAKSSRRGRRNKRWQTRLIKIIRRPIITEKGLGVKETQHTVVFEVAADATKTEIKEAVQHIFKVKVDARAHGDLSRQVSPPRTRRRLSQRLEEGLREARRQAKR